MFLTFMGFTNIEGSKSGLRRILFMIQPGVDKKNEHVTIREMAGVEKSCADRRNGRSWFEDSDCF